MSRPRLVALFLLSLLILPLAAHAQEALFVAGNVDLNASDSTVQAILVRLGYTVTVVDDGDSQPTDADGKALVFVSETVSSGNVSNKFELTTVPVVVGESYVMDDMKMILTSGNVPDAEWTTDMEILDDTHPMATGFTSGQIVTVFSDSAATSMGQDPNPATAIFIAAVPATSYFTLFGYEAGADMQGLAAPGRRVGVFMHGGSAPVTIAGKKLLENAFLWAAGRESEISPDGGYVGHAGRRALFVAGNVNLNRSDSTVYGVMEKLGYTIRIVDDGDSVTGDADGQDLVFASETVSSGNVSTKFRDVTVPVVVGESYIMDDMNMTITAANVPDAEWSTDMEILDDTSPMARGYTSGQVVTVFDLPAATVMAQDPNPETAIFVAAVPATSYFTLYGYETGVQMQGLAAPARRVGIFMHGGSSSITVDGHKLLENAFLWAAGREAEIGPNGGYGGITAIDDEPGELPASFAIDSVYPNPFNPTTTVSVSTRLAGRYDVRVYNLLGQRVQEFTAMLQPGSTELRLDLGAHPSGLYLLQVVQDATHRAATSKVVLLK